MKTLKITWMAPIAVPNEVTSKQKTVLELEVYMYSRLML